MDMQSMEGRCAVCGARVRPGTEECPTCHGAAVDPSLNDLRQQVETGGAAALRAYTASRGCNGIGCATLMLHYLAAPDPDLRQAAADALRSSTDHRVLQELLVLLATHRWLGEPVRANLSESEAGATSIPAVVRSVFAQPEEKHLLLESLHHQNMHVREIAAALLQHQSGPDVRDALVQALQSDRDPVVRARAAQGLGKLCDPSTADALNRALHDSSSMVQGKAAEALGRLGAVSVRSAANTLATGEPAAALHSAMLLSQVGSPDAVQALIDTLRNSQGLARLYATQALVQIGDEVLPRLLETLIRDSDSVGLRDGIRYVLRHLRMPQAKRDLIVPVLEALDGLTPALDAPAAAYTALGNLEGLTPDQLKARLGNIR